MDRRLPDACLQKCNYNVYNKDALTRMYFKQDECPLAAMAEIQFCAAQGGDHRECCARNGVTTTLAGEKCLTFCDQRPGKITQLDPSYIPCFDRFESTIIMLYILINPLLWPVLLLYGVWYYYDRHTPWRGSRASKFVRNIHLWKYCGQYFDAELVKTVDIPGDHNYIFSCHPHGAIGIGTFLSFGTEATGIAKAFPKLKFRLVTLPINFYFPLHREVFTFLGVIPSDAESIEYALNIAPKGRAVAIVPGGAEEAMDSHTNNYDLTLKDRKGFVKLAIRNGASLVPVYNFGENKTYHQLPNERGSYVRKIQTIIKRATGISPILVCGAGFFNNHFGLIPMSVKITTVVGAPIHTKKNPNPTKEEVDNLHSQYVEALVKLFEDHKLKYDVPEHVHLRIL